MTYLDYNIFYKTELPLERSWPSPVWDIFISAFNSSDRVSATFQKATAQKKYWVIHNEYRYTNGERPAGNVFVSNEGNEAPFVRSLVDYIEQDATAKLSELSICVDITGFMRPHLLFLTLYLSTLGVRRYDVLYSEPLRYARKEKTTFSAGGITVRQVAGFEGLNSPNHSDDLLIIGSGYDHRLIKAVAEHKDKADKVQIFGLPSLGADMYQENVLSAYQATDAIGTNKTFDISQVFAPANDPFVTASTLREIVTERRKLGPISNLYLSPLATKPQALGFALFYLGECLNTCTSILFPISSSYSRETSVGLSRVWMYAIEYPLF